MGEKDRPLQYWANNHAHFPLLAAVVVKFLSAPSARHPISWMKRGIVWQQREQKCSYPSKRTCQGWSEICWTLHHSLSVNFLRSHLLFIVFFRRILTDSGVKLNPGHPHRISCFSDFLFWSYTISSCLLGHTCIHTYISYLSVERSLFDDDDDDDNIKANRALVLE